MKPSRAKLLNRSEAAYPSAILEGPNRSAPPLKKSDSADPTRVVPPLKAQGTKQA
jgi:hypothetical protein